jgi:hypothetical protein
MDEHQDPSKVTESGKDKLIGAAGNLKEAAGAKAEDLRRAAGQKADVRSAAQGKAQELRGTAESAWSEATSKAKSWHSEGEAHVRDNPTKAVLIALGLAFCWVFCCGNSAWILPRRWELKVPNHRLLSGTWLSILFVT